MPKVKLLLWIAIILVILTTAGCTGTKTAVDTGHVGASASAADLYHAKVNDLKQQIGEIKAMARPDNNSTLEDYQKWLGQYRDGINDTWKQYNETAESGNAYLLRLDNTSDEYRGVTSDLDVYKNDINGLESDYRQMVADLAIYKAKFDALNAYKDALNVTASAYNNLTRYGSKAKINSLGDYSTYVGGYKVRLDDYDARCNDAIDAGQAYQQYCDPGSEEYAGIEQNEKSLNDGIGLARASYNKIKSDLDNKYRAQAAANDYTSKVNKVSAAKTDLDQYDSASSLQKLNYTYVIGYRQKVKALDSLCGDAIASGNNCLQYLDTNSTEYKTVTDNNKAMEDAKTHYDASLDKMVTMYNNLHMLSPIS